MFNKKGVARKPLFFCVKNCFFCEIYLHISDIIRNFAPQSLDDYGRQFRYTTF